MCIACIQLVLSFTILFSYLLTLHLQNVCCLISLLPSVVCYSHYCQVFSVCVCVCVVTVVSELSVLLAQQHPQLAALLSRIQFASVAVVNIQYHSNVLPVEVYSHTYQLQNFFAPTPPSLTDNLQN